MQFAQRKHSAYALSENQTENGRQNTKETIKSKFRIQGSQKIQNKKKYYSPKLFDSIITNDIKAHAPYTFGDEKPRKN